MLFHVTLNSENVILLNFENDDPRRNAYLTNLRAFVALNNLDRKKAITLCFRSFRSKCNLSFGTKEKNNFIIC